jgi:poly-gamma-glutamate synthesis protein (capsule biosynthesis protein)
MANLEFAVNPARVIEKIVRFSMTEAHAEVLLGDRRFGRFHHVSSANNHINDSLSGGIDHTCEYLDRVGVSHVGANRTMQEQDEFPIVECRGVKIALLAYTFSTNGIALDADRTFGANVVRFNALRDADYDPDLVHHHIELARKRGVDLIVSSHHWGVEFEYYPPARIVTRAHELLDAGIDIIVGHHPHILNPTEWHVTPDGRTTVCLYSLGNLTSWALLHPMQRLSEVAEVVVGVRTDGAGKRLVAPEEVTLTPVFHRMRSGRGGRNHRLVPLLETARRIRNGDRPAWLNAREARTVLAVEKEYNRYFRQSCFSYR